jgi:hypothetical protein
VDLVVPFVSCRATLSLPIQRASPFVYLARAVSIHNITVEDVLRALSQPVKFQAAHLYCVVEFHVDEADAIYVGPNEALSSHVQVVSFNTLWANHAKLASHLITSQHPGEKAATFLVEYANALVQQK